MKGVKPIRNCFLVLGLLLVGLGSSSAQITHYLFFQTENNKPFYLRIMGSTLSSNASGYLLIPKLTDGKYELHIGFAQSEAEQQFEITVEGRDLGFSVKQELDNSWSLFNLVDFSQYKGKTVAAVPKPQIKTEEEPVLTDTVKEEEKPVVKKENRPTDSLVKPEMVKEVQKKKIPLPLIAKIYDKTSLDGIDMVFVVNGTPKSDTVIIYVPAIKPSGMAGGQLKSRVIQYNKGEQVFANPFQSIITNPFKHP